MFSFFGLRVEGATVAAHKGPVTAVAFSPNGKTFVTGGGDNLVKVWNAANYQEENSRSLANYIQPPVLENNTKPLAPLDPGPSFT